MNTKNQRQLCRHDYYFNLEARYDNRENPVFLEGVMKPEEVLKSLRTFGNIYIIRDRTTGEVFHIEKGSIGKKALEILADNIIKETIVDVIKQINSQRSVD